MVAITPSSLAIAESGLRTNNARLAIMGTNMANAGNPEHSQQIMRISASVNNGMTIGVDALPIERIEDPLRTKDVRDKTIEASRLEVLNNFQQEIQSRMGNPQNENSLGSQLTDIKTALRSLADAPELSGHRNEVVRLLKKTVRDINELGDFYQRQRQVAENGIGDTVGRINTILKQLEALNQDIGTNVGRGETTASFNDKQDALLKELSSYMDIKIYARKSGGLDITTNTGEVLLRPTGAGTISFTPAVGMRPQETTATLGTLSVDGTNITTSISSGKIGGFLQVRDNIMPNLQAELDEFVVNLRDTLNAIHNQGTGHPAPQALTGAHSFTDPAVDTVEMTGVVRIAVIDNDTGNFVGTPYDLDLTAGPQNLNTIAGLINAGLGVNGSASINADNQLVIGAASANHGIAIVSMTDPEATDTTSGLGFSHHFGLNNLLGTSDRFINDGHVDGNIGLAQKLRLRSDIEANANFLSRGRMNTTMDFTKPAIYSGDSSNVKALESGFDTSITFSQAGKLASRSESLVKYANSIWHNAAIDSMNTKTDYDTQQAILEQSEGELLARTGVNIQEQVLGMMELLSQSQALAKVIETQRAVNNAIMAAM